MVHPLFRSKNGAILYRELPEVMRLYDNRTPGPDGQLGDLEAFLFGFGHMLDRYEATLEQFYADGFLDPVTLSGEEVAIQGWLLPYVAELFGVELLAPDADSRRRELAASIWIARRRGTKAAIDHAAETILDAPVVVVDGSRRVLRTPHMGPMVTHRERVGLWHPKDANILLEDLPPHAPETHETGFAATRPKRHAGLPVGTPDTRRHMRARAVGLERPDADVRPVSGSGDLDSLASFAVQDRRGVPCFPDSYEDRSLRTPDSRGPRPNRPRFTALKRPDAVNLFIRPPDGFFDAHIIELAEAPVIEDGAVARPAALGEDDETDQVYFNDLGEVAIAPATAGPDGQHVIDGLKFAGTLLIEAGTDVRLENCAIGTLRFASDYEGDFHAKSCLFVEIDADDYPIADAEPAPVFEYVTVTESAAFAVVLASDCLFAGTLTVAGDGTDAMLGCIRYSRVPSDFDRDRVHMYLSTFGSAQFQIRPCIEESPGNFVSRIPELGEQGFGVLADTNPAAVAQGAEDGGEVGAYHDQHHLSRLRAALLKAGRYAPAGRRIFGHYDMRLLANLPD